MRKADEKLMNQLGAKYVKGTEEEILKVVLSEIDNLEDGFCQKQKNYMDYAYKSRDIGKCDIIFPFLKSTHKVQKMSTQREKHFQSKISANNRRQKMGNQRICWHNYGNVAEN